MTLSQALDARHFNGRGRIAYYTVRNDGNGSSRRVVCRFIGGQVKIIWSVNDNTVRRSTDAEDWKRKDWEPYVKRPVQRRRS